MSQLTIKEYAIKHKISIFNVMKMVKSQELKTISKIIDGKEITLIIEEENQVSKQTVTSKALSDDTKQTVQDEIEFLKEEVNKLRSELNKLKVTVFKMGKKDAKILKI